MKQFVDVGSQTLTDVSGWSGSKDPRGCPDCSEDMGGKEWGPGDLTDIREFAGYTYGEANAQLGDCVIANQMAKELLEHPEQITSASVTEVLNKWQFAKNVTRRNVLEEGQEYGYSDTVGVVRTWGQ